MKPVEIADDVLKRLDRVIIHDMEYAARIKDVDY